MHFSFCMVSGLYLMYGENVDFAAQSEIIAMSSESFVLLVFVK